MRGETSNIRFDEAKKLLDYGFSNFKYLECNKKHDIIKNVEVSKGTSTSLDIICENDCGCLIKKGEDQNITSNLNLYNENLSAPIYKGEKLGEITYTVNNQIVGKVNLIAKEDIKELTFINTYTKIIEKWFKLLR